MKGNQVPLEGPVDRDSYLIGPNDLLTIGIWGEEEQIIPIPVTPEGTIIVPSVGIIPVAGKTIRAAEEEVIDTLKYFYKTDRITLTLTGIRNIKVFVSGQVEVRGALIVTPVDRVSDAITQAGGLREGASRRSVNVRRRDGSECTVDLVRFLVFGNLDDNPLLQDGDRISVPVKRGFVRVRGEVNGFKEIQLDKRTLREGQLSFPAEEVLVEFKPGDRIRDVIAMAGGISESADLAHVVIKRITETSTDSTFVVDLRDLYHRGADSLDIDMQSGDVVHIPVSKDFVYVVGAVRIPGMYPYESSFTAGDYISLAGGYTSSGKSSRWNALSTDGEKRNIKGQDQIYPGETIVVTERFLVKLGRVLSPLTAISTITIAIAAITR